MRDETLAVRGGEPVRTKPYPWPIYDDQERALLQQVLESGRWSYGGPVEQKLEREFAEYLGVEHAFTVSSGTAALEIALQALNLAPGDEVLLPALTWTAPARAIVVAGARPVFVDISPADWCADPSALAAAVTARTRAILVVHTYSHMAGMDAVGALAEHHGLAIVEDCAHAHGSSWRGRRAGAIGTLGCFSFQSSKAMTAGEGGLIVTNDGRLADRVYGLRNCGRPRTAGGLHGFGGNYRMTEFQSAILCAQMSRLDDQIGRKTHNVSRFERLLESVPGLSVMPANPAMDRRNLFGLSLGIDRTAFGAVSTQRIVAALAAEGIPVFLPHDPVYLSPLWRSGSREAWLATDAHQRLGLGAQCPVAEAVASHRGLVVAHEAFLGSDGDTDDVVVAFDKVRRLAADLPAIIHDDRPI